MINSSITYQSIEPIYDIAIPIKHLNLEKYFYKNDADNICAINNYLTRYDLDVYAVNRTANNILIEKKDCSKIELITTGYYIQLKGILYGTGLIKDYPGPSFGYIRKTKLRDYVVFFDVENKFKSRDVMADLFIKVDKPFWMKKSNTIDLKFINTTFLNTFNEYDELESDDEDDYWWQK